MEHLQSAHKYLQQMSIDKKKKKSAKARAEADAKAARDHNLNSTMNVNVRVGFPMKAESLPPEQDLFQVQPADNIPDVATADKIGANEME